MISTSSSNYTIADAIATQVETVNLYTQRLNFHYLTCEDRLTSLKEIVDVTLTRLYAQHSVSSSPFDVIIGYLGGGEISGDTIFPFKTAELLAQRYPQAHIYLYDYYDCEERRPYAEFRQAKEIWRRLPSHDRLTFVSDLSYPLINGKFKKGGKPLFIFDLACPTPYFHKHIEELIKDRKDTFVCHLEEYNGWRMYKYSPQCSFDLETPCQWYSGGFGFSQRGKDGLSTPPCPNLGIHIDKTLALPKNISNVDRLTSILELENHELSNALFKDFENNPLHAYSQHNKLYFAYLSHTTRISLYYYIASVILSQSDSHQAIDFVIVTNSWEIDINSIADIQNIASLPTNGCSKHAKTSLTHINEDNSLTNETIGNSFGKNVRFFVLPKLVHADMLRMIRGSEPVVHVSGDQSFAETISMKGKILFYQLQPWKRDLAKSYQHEAELYFSKQKSSLYASYLKVMFAALNEKIDQPDNLIYEDTVEEIANYLKAPGLYEEVYEFHEMLCKQHNIDDWIIGKINRTLSHLRNGNKVESRSFKSIDLTGNRQTIIKHTERCFTTISKSLSRKRKEPTRDYPLRSRAKRRRRSQPIPNRDKH